MKSFLIGFAAYIMAGIAWSIPIEWEWYIYVPSVFLSATAFWMLVHWYAESKK